MALGPRFVFRTGGNYGASTRGSIALTGSGMPFSRDHSPVRCLGHQVRRDRESRDRHHNLRQGVAAYITRCDLRLDRAKPAYWLSARCRPLSLFGQRVKTPLHRAKVSKVCKSVQKRKPPRWRGQMGKQRQRQNSWQTLRQMPAPPQWTWIGASHRF